MAPTSMAGVMFDMLQLVGVIGKIQATLKLAMRQSMQEVWYLGSPKVSVPSLDDKLKHVGHSG
jgi:hypothetical protein